LILLDGIEVARVTGAQGLNPDVIILSEADLNVDPVVLAAQASAAPMTSNVAA